MKHLALIITFMLSSLSIQAQVEAPKKGFLVVTSADEVFVVPGQSASVEVEFVRSKRFRNKDIVLAVPGRLPEGLEVEITQPTDGTKGKVVFSAKNGAQEGIHSLIIQGKSPSFTKGTLLKIAVHPETISAR